jgi:hypothetical protein
MTKPPHPATRGGLGDALAHARPLEIGDRSFHTLYVIGESAKTKVAVATEHAPNTLPTGLLPRTTGVVMIDGHRQSASETDGAKTRVFAHLCQRADAVPLVEPIRPTLLGSASRHARGPSAVRVATLIDSAPTPDGFPVSLAILRLLLLTLVATSLSSWTTRLGRSTTSNDRHDDPAGGTEGRPGVKVDLRQHMTRSAAHLMIVLAFRQEGRPTRRSRPL